MKILVTGGSGFVGSHLVDRLVAEGHDVIALDNHLTGEKGNVHAKAKLVEADITDYDSILPHFEGIDAVFHMAAIPRMAWATEIPRLTAQINVFGTVNVLDAAREKKVKRFIYSSSYAVEHLESPYSVSKFAGEEFVRIYHSVYGLSTISLRYSNIYGIRQSEKGSGLNLVASLKRSKREDGKIWITGDGTQSRDQIHVSDVVEANILALKSDVTGWFDICTGVNVSLNELAKHFDCPIEYRPAKKHDPAIYHPNPEPAAKILGFRAKVKFEDGIKEVL